MPALPSGRYVDIMSDRARYHAARTGLRIKNDTPHARLYALVDILVERPRAKNTARQFGFSGHTLDDARWLRKWGAEDRASFLSWVREAPQVRLIEQARRRVLADDNQPRERVFEYPERLYSGLRQRVEHMDLPRATPEHWRRTLLNLRQDGIKNEELHWSGIFDFLAGLPQNLRIDKDVIADSMDFSGVRPRLIQELVCAQGCNLPFQEEARKLQGYELQLAGLPATDQDIGVIRLSSTEPSYKIGALWPNGKAIAPQSPTQWFALGPYGEAIHDGTTQKRLLFATQELAVDAAKSHALRGGRARCDLQESTRYDYMSLHGGDHYREWLITLPEFTFTHFSGHYFERNVLAHARTKVRQTERGERVLFIEEIQSDWHQALARGSARGIVPRAPYRNDWVGLVLKLLILHAVAQNLDGIAWADGQVHEMRYDKPLPPLRRLYDKIIPDTLNRLGRPWGLTTGTAQFATLNPWLHAERHRDGWRVKGGAGKFATRTRYTKDQALRLIGRHSKAVTLTLPILLFNDTLRTHITTHGLPLFGTQTGFQKG